MDQKAPHQDTHAAFWGIAATLALTVTIWLTAPLLKDVAHIEDYGASLYWWQLPERTATVIIFLGRSYLLFGTTLQKLP
jgi:hypothetical protein